MDLLSEIISSSRRFHFYSNLKDGSLNQIHSFVPLTRNLCEKVFHTDKGGEWSFMKFKVKTKGKERYTFTLLKKDESSYILYDDSNGLPILSVLSSTEYSAIMSGKANYWITVLRVFGMDVDSDTLLNYRVYRKTFSQNTLKRLQESFPILYTGDDNTSETESY